LIDIATAGISLVWWMEIIIHLQCYALKACIYRGLLYVMRVST